MSEKVSFYCENKKCEYNSLSGNKVRFPINKCHRVGYLKEFRYLNCEDVIK